MTFDITTAERTPYRPQAAPKPGVGELFTVTSERTRAAVDAYKAAVATYGASDVVNSYTLVNYMAGGVRYAEGLGFMVWDGVKWVRSRVQVRQAAHDLGAALTAAVPVRRAELEDEARRDTSDLTEAARRAKAAEKDDPMIKAAAGFTASSRIDNMLKELASVRGVYIEPEELDSHAPYLTFANGTVDLRTGELLPHDPDHLITTALPYDYNPEAKCPRWEKFLQEIFPDQTEMPGYMQRLTGYGITGSTAEQCFAVMIGKGANGKSVYLDTLTYVFDEISQTTGFETFEADRGAIPADLAALRDARLVMASEGESGKAMSESVLKRATGSDKMTARFMRENFFTFQPRFLLWLATNHRPNFKSQDNGLWRRVKLIEFTKTFAEHEKDHGIFEKLRAEREGIAAWAVRGAIDWYASKLGEPKRIKDATANLRETSDALAEFLTDVMVKTEDEGHRVPLQEAYNAYRDWCEASNERPWTKRGFAAAMDERGIRKVRASAGMVLTGVRMVGADAPAGPGIFAND